MQRSAVIHLGRLYWVGPATVAVAVLAVELVRRIAANLLSPLPRAFVFPLTSIEPLVITAVLVTFPVIVFALVSDMSVNPLTTYRRLALVVLVVSFVPDIAVAVSSAGDSWPAAIALMAMHVAAWAVSVTMLTRLTVVRSHDSIE